jgi:hypothetical protein
VRIDGIDPLTGAARAECEPGGRSSFPRSDLDDRAASGYSRRGVEQRLSLVVAQPAFDRRCNGPGVFQGACPFAAATPIRLQKV